MSDTPRNLSPKVITVKKDSFKTTQDSDMTKESNKQNQVGVMDFLCNCCCMFKSAFKTSSLAINTGIVKKQPRELVPEQSTQNFGKKTLVLDLDETLVHSSAEPIDGADFIVDMENVENMRLKLYVKKRNGAEFLIKEMAKYFELVLFTASLRDYAEPVINELDPEQLISIRLFRENCSFSDNKVVKDLNILRRNLKDIIIVDNSSQSFQMQPNNGIHVKTYLGVDDSDEELVYMMPFLIFLSGIYDVRKVSSMYKRYFSRKYIRFLDLNQKEGLFDKMSVQNEIFKKYKLFNDKQKVQVDLLQTQLDSIEEDDDMLNSGRKSFRNGKDHFANLRKKVYGPEDAGQSQQCSSDQYPENPTDKVTLEEIDQIISASSSPEKKDAQILSSSDTIDVSKPEPEDCNKHSDMPSSAKKHSSFNPDDAFLNHNSDEINAHMRLLLDNQKMLDQDLANNDFSSGNRASSNYDCEQNPADSEHNHMMSAFNNLMYQPSVFISQSNMLIQDEPNQNQEQVIQSI